MKTVYLLDARMPRNENLYCRLVKIRFIYDKKGTQPYTIWADYRKVGEAYLLDERDDPHKQLADWIPEEEHRLTPETHRIKIVDRTLDARPLRLKNARTHAYNGLKKQGEIDRSYRRL